MPSRYHKALSLVHQAFERGLAQGGLDLASITDLLEPLAALPGPAIDLATIVTALDYLPGDPWRAELFLLRVGDEAGQHHGPHGLLAADLGEGHVLLTLRTPALAFPAFYWLAMLWVQAGRLAEKSRAIGLTERLGSLFAPDAPPPPEEQVGQALSEVAFCAGTDLATLAELDGARGGRLTSCVVALATQAWRPRLTFHQDLDGTSPADDAYAENVVAATAERCGQPPDADGDARVRPLHVILTDTPAITDVLSPYCRELRPVLTQWAREHPERVAGGEVVLAAIAGDTVSENLLYWVLRDFLTQDPGLVEELVSANATVGIHQHGATLRPGSFTLVDLAALDTELTDPRLWGPTPGPGDSERARPHRPHPGRLPGADGCLLVLPLQDGRLACAALALVLDRLRDHVASVNVLRRALPLMGTPQLILPQAWLDQESGACLYAPATAPSDLSAEDFWGLIEGEVTAAGAVLSVPSSIGQHPMELAALADQHGVTAMDRGGHAVLNTLLASCLKVGGVPRGWTWRAVYYACERLLESDDLRGGLSESAMLAPAYAAAVAVLRAILRGPSHGEPPAPARGGPPEPRPGRGRERRVRLRA